MNVDFVSKRCDGRRRISSSARKQMDLLHYNYNTTFIIDTRKQMDLLAQQHNTYYVNIWLALKQDHKEER